MPIVSIPDKNMRIRFPDDMDPKAIEQAIRENVYGGYVLPGTRKIAQGLREEDSWNVRSQASSTPPDEATVRNAMEYAQDLQEKAGGIEGQNELNGGYALPETQKIAQGLREEIGGVKEQDKQIQDIASLLPKEATVSDATEYASWIPYLGIKALHGLTGWFFKSFQNIPTDRMSPIQRATVDAFGDADTAMQTAVEYWRKATGNKDIDIPNATIGRNEDGSLAIKPAKPISLRETLGTTAEFTGQVLGPVKGALSGGYEVAELTAKYARPFYRSIMRGMVGGALLGEGDKDKTLQNMALFGIFEPLAYLIGKAPEAPETIRESAPWRKMTIKERGLTLQSLDDMIQKNPDMTEAEILRRWDNPQWRKQALERRMTPMEQAGGQAGAPVRTSETGMAGITETTGQGMVPAATSRVTVPPTGAPTTQLPTGPAIEAGSPLSIPAEQKPAPIETTYTKKLSELKKVKGDQAYFDDEVMSLSTKQKGEIEKAYRERHPKGPAVLYKDDMTRGVLITPSSKEPGKVQMTHFDDHGFSMDSQFDSEADAMKEAYTDGYRIPDPGRAEKQLSSEKFMKGVESLEEAQKRMEEGSQGKTFYRGTVPDETKKIEDVFDAAKGKTWVARERQSAENYGENIEEIQAKPDAKILYQEDPAFWRLIHKRKPPNGAITSLKGGAVKNVNNAIQKAEKAGYDAISFRSDSDIGTVILNEDAFIRKQPAKQKGEDLKQSAEKRIDELLYAPTTPNGKARFDLKTKREQQDFKNGFMRGLEGENKRIIHGEPRKYQDAHNSGWIAGRQFARKNGVEVPDFNKQPSPKEALPEKQPWEMTPDEWVKEHDKIPRAKRITKGGAKGYYKGAQKHETIPLTPEQKKHGEALTKWLSYGVQKDSQAPITHKDVVRKALSEGKPVPDNVLAKYPDLQKAGGEGRSAAQIEHAKQAEGEKEAGQVLKNFERHFQAFPTESKNGEDVFKEQLDKWIDSDNKTPPQRIYGYKGTGRPISSKIVENPPTKAQINYAKNIADKAEAPVAIVTKLDKAEIPRSRFFVEFPVGSRPNVPGAMDSVIAEDYLDAGFEGTARIDKWVTPKQKAPAKQKGEAGARKVGADRKRRSRNRELARDAKNFRMWLKYSGGINRQDKTWKGEIRDMVGKKGMAKGFPPGIFRKNALGVDEMTQKAIEDGWLLEGATDQDFMDALQNNPDTKPVAGGEQEDLDKLVQEENDRIAQLEEDLRNDGYSESDIRKAISGGEAKEETSTDKRASGEKEPVDQGGFNWGTGEFEKPVLTPEEETPWEKAQRLKREGAVQFGEKSKSKAVIPEEGIAPATGGRQAGLFGPQEQENKELFSGRPPGRPEKAKAVSETFTPIPKGKRRSAILKKASKALQVPIRTGKFRTQRGGLKAAGIYKPGPKVIRLAKANDFETAIHEIGHHIENLLGLPKKMPPEVQAMAYEGAADPDREGFAEFLRNYVTAPQAAKERAPDFYQTFERALKAQPDVGEVIKEARNAWNVWQESPSVGKVHSFIQRGTSRKTMPTMSRVYTSVKDALYPLQEAVKEAEKQGATVGITENPYLMARLTRGWTRKAEQYLKYGPFQYDAEQGVVFSGKSLRAILKPIDKANKIELLDTYLVAKRALHDPRIQQGFSGMLSLEDFRQTVQELEPEFGETAKDLYEYSDQLLTFLTNSGRISKEMADAIRKRNLFYAPLYRVMDWEAPMGGLSSKRFSSVFNPIKRLGKSSRDIYSPSESLVYNTFVTINAAERNRVGNALQRLAKKPGMGAIIEQVPPRIKPVQMTAKEALESLTSGISDPAEKEAMKETLSGIPKDVLQQMVTAFRPNYTPKPNEALFYSDGKPVLYEIDPKLAKAIGNISSSDIDMLTRAMSYPAKWLRAGATTFSPEFAIRNPFRDQMTAYLQTKYGFKPGIDFLRGLFHMVFKTNLWQRFNASGAAHSALMSTDRNYISKSLKDITRGNIKGLVKHPLELLQAFSEYTEEATRVGEKARGLKKEGPGYEGLLKTGLAAREVSLDFARQGEAGARAANLISAFWNARLEGLDKMRRTFRDNPMKATAKAFLGITLPSVLLWYAQKDDPYYQEIPAWRRTLFWNFVRHNKDGTLKHIISIPKPFEYGLIFGSVPETALDWGYSKDPSTFKETMKSVGQVFNLAPIPTGLVPLGEWWANKSWFFDRPIVPRGKENLEPPLQYGEHTSETTKLIAKMMDKVPGLKEVASPAKIENMIRGYTGAFGQLAMEAGDGLIKSLGVIDVPPDPSMTLADIPGIRGFAARYPSANTRSIETFYKRYNDLNTKWESQRQRAGIRGTGIQVKAPEKLSDYRTAAKALSTLRKMAHQVYESKTMDSKSKRESLDNLYVCMMNVARKALKRKPIFDKKLKQKPPKGR